MVPEESFTDSPDQQNDEQVGPGADEACNLAGGTDDNWSCPASGTALGKTLLPGQGGSREAGGPVSRPAPQKQPWA